MKQGRTLAKIPILNNETANTLKVELYYSKGGVNYFTGSNEVRGLYLSVSPVKITNYEGGGSSESFVAFTGIKKMVKETKRFNQKELDTFVIDEVTKESLIKYVITKNNLEIEKEILVVS